MVGTDFAIPREEMERCLVRKEALPALEFLLQRYYRKTMAYSIQQHPEAKSHLEAMVRWMNEGDEKNGWKALASAAERLATPNSKTEIPPEKDLPALLKEVQQEVHSFLEFSDAVQPCFVEYHKLFGRRTARLWKEVTLCTVGMAGTAGLSALSDIALLEIPFGLFGYFFAQGAYQLLRFNRRKMMSHYHPYSRCIVLAKEPEKELVSTLAHEYTHYLQHVLRGECHASSPFEEGYARGIERKMGGLYAERRQNGGYARSAYENTVLDLYRAYLWICDHLEENPRLFIYFPALISLPEKVSKIPQALQELLPPLPKDLDAHALGTTFFCLLEAVEGEGIYKAILHGEYTI